MKLEQVDNGWVLTHETKTLKVTDHEAMRLRTSTAAQRKGYLWRSVMPRLEGTRPDRRQLSEEEQRLRAWLNDKNVDWAGAYPAAVASPLPKAAPAAPQVSGPVGGKPA